MHWWINEKCIRSQAKTPRDGFPTSRETLKTYIDRRWHHFAVSGIHNKFLRARVKPPVGGQEGGSKGKARTVRRLVVTFTSQWLRPGPPFPERATQGNLSILSFGFFDDFFGSFSIFSFDFFQNVFFIWQHQTQTASTFPGVVGREMVGRGRTRQTRIWNQGH